MAIERDHPKWHLVLIITDAHCRLRFVRIVKVQEVIEVYFSEDVPIHYNQGQHRFFWQQRECTGSAEPLVLLEVSDLNLPTGAIPEIVHDYVCLVIYGYVESPETVSDKSLQDGFQARPASDL